jgi:invasion protein IalB
MRSQSLPGARSLAIRALLGLLLFPAGIGGIHAAQPSPPQKPVAGGPGSVQQFGSWVMTCPGGKANCILMQQLSETLSRNVVFVWLLQYDDSGNLMSVFRTPSGVFIKPGLQIRMDSSKQSLKVDFERCDPGQCQAVFSIPGDLLKQISAAKTLSVSLALTTGQTVDVALKMDGFSGAIAALSQKRGTIE